MAPVTEAVLGVIRASRPDFRSAHDRVAFALHATFLASGYSLAATGSEASSASLIGLEDQEVGIDGWNLLENAYAFSYFTEEKKHVDVRCMVINDLLMVDVAIVGDGTGSDLLHLEIRSTDYVNEGSLGNYSQHYKDLDGLVKLISSQIIMKCMKDEPPTTPARDRGKCVLYEAPGDICPNRYPGATPGIGVFRTPKIAFDDLLPGAGAGVLDQRKDEAFESGEAGNVIGLHNPMFGADPCAHDRAPVRIGIRQDPFGHPGVAGFESNRFGRGARDTQHFSGL